MTPVRPLAVSAVALSIAGAFMPIPASAAPAPCEGAGNYAAQSGAELLRLNKLDLRPAGNDHDPITGVGLADAQSALISAGTVNSAAVSRMLDAKGTDGLARPLIQQAPPSHAKAGTRAIDGGDAGPFTFGDGTLTSHARWAPGMVCGVEDGDVTRAAALLSTASILRDDKNTLVTVRSKGSSLSTTTLDGRGSAVRAVASATIDASTIDLLGGTVRINVKRTPTLVASMTAKGDGEVRYAPAVLEVSGKGIDTARLDAAGDKVEITVAKSQPQNSAGASPQPQNSESPRTLPEQTSPTESTAAGLLGGLLAKTPAGGLGPGSPPPLPTAPGVPSVGEEESAPAAGPGTTLRVALGGVRQARSGHAIAARVTAVKITLTQGPSSDETPDGYGNSAADRGGVVVMDLGVGALEAAAVAPGPTTGGAQEGGVQGAASGQGGGLPITGPRVGPLAIAGVALLVLGAAAMVFGKGRRRTRP